MLRETDPQTTIWELLLPDAAKRLPAELARVDASLDDERFIAPCRALVDRRLGRPSVPVDTLLRLLYRKHRYGLGYESLCREVADSISWRRCCRIGLDRPVPHPTTLARAGAPRRPEHRRAAQQRPAGKLRQDKLLRVRKLRVDTTVVQADIDHPPTPTCWSRPSGSWAGWCGAARAAARPAAPDSGTGHGRRGGGSSRAPGPCGGAPGRRRRRLIGSPPRSPASPGGRLGRPSGWPTPPVARGVPGPATAALGGWSGGSRRRPW